MITSTVSPKYQVVIPSPIRKKLQKLGLSLNPGDEWEIEADEKGIQLYPILSPDQLIGYLKGPDLLELERDNDRSF